MAVLIELRGVSNFEKDGRAIFDNAELVLSGGERIIISAPLASGKSVLLRMLAGLSKPDEGAVYIFGRDIASAAPEELSGIRKRMGFVFQDSVLISNLKVIENVALPLLYHSDFSYEECLERALVLLDKTGFRGEAWGLPGPLPVYAKKEATIARALALEPEIIVCENLSSGLTNSEMEHLTGVLLEYHGKRPDRLLVMTTYIDSEIDLIKPDRVIRIVNGKFSG